MGICYPSRFSWQHLVQSAIGLDQDDILLASSTYPRPMDGLDDIDLVLECDGKFLRVKVAHVLRFFGGDVPLLE
jgi:hypothetical protein